MPPASDLFRTIPAATVVIFRRCPLGGPPELLMLQRSKAMRFAGGATVFPGGRIDLEDRLLAAQLMPEADQDIAAAQIAGVRETLEETGLAIAIAGRIATDEAIAARALLLEQGALAPILEHFGWTLALDRLVPFAHWRPSWDGAFDTRFFLHDLGTGEVKIAVDATENTRLFWAGAAQALAMADAREISVLYPTRRNLERLALFASFAEARAQAEQFPVHVISPAEEQRDGELWLTIPEGCGYPVTGQPMATAERG